MGFRPTTPDEQRCEGDGFQRRLVPAEGGLNISAKRDIDGHTPPHECLPARLEGNEHERQPRR